MQTDRQRRYQALYEAQDLPPLYTAPWWLDVTCGKDGWDALLIHDPVSNAEIAIPYFITRIRGLSAIVSPPATQWVQLLSGPGQELNFHPSVLEHFPKSSIFDLSIKTGKENVLEGKGFSAMIHYSYVSSFHDVVEKMKGGYNEGLRRNLKQAEKIFDLQESDDVRTFISLCKTTYAQRSMKPPWWFVEKLPAITALLIKEKKGSLSFVFKNGQAIAAMLTGWDNHADFYLAGGRLATDEGTSAHALLLDRAVTQAHGRGNDFDFEGSMVPGIANFFQSFGAHPFPYTRIRRFKGLGLLWSMLQ
jgi:hypothetical protein